MMYIYDAERMCSLLEQLLRKTITEKAFIWLEQQQQRFEKEKQSVFFNMTFTAIPRSIEKEIIHPNETEIKALQRIRKNIDITGWSADRLARSWWLLHLPSENQEQYTQHIENLFKSAEMNEQVALYGALPLLAYPEQFRLRTAEGIRSNIGVVFETVALHNPYPSEYLDEAPWNQMVLKAFFMNKPVNRIIGLDQRANQNLARILSDYAHERWAASRPVNPLLWRPVSKFIDQHIFPDIQKLFLSGNDREIKAAALACSQSNYEPAKKLLNQYPEWKKQIEEGVLTWEQFTT
jgi:hypothetical protein